ncbi:MAG: DUF2282 domain-containing protein [Pseudomonadota bacterium]
MSVSKKALNTVIASAFVVTMAGAATLPGTANAAETEKCYGVVKAGKNGCASADGKHSCEAQATVDGSGQEWVSTPKGLCEKLIGGSTTPFEGMGFKKAAMEHAEGK